MEDKDFSSKIKKIAKKTIMKALMPIIIKVLVIVTIIVILVGGFSYVLDILEGVINEANPANVPGQASKYRSKVSIGSDGKITAGRTAQEVWDELKKNDSGVENYLKNPEELAKLMNAELITSFPDTRSDVSKPIDWSKVDLANGELQGVVKFKRADRNGNISYMTYVDPDTYYGWIEQYNDAGDSSVSNKIQSHFTLEEQPDVSTSVYGNVEAETITAGQSINVPPGLGTFGTREFDLSTSKTSNGGYPYGFPASSTQRKVQNQWIDAGAVHDEKGFCTLGGRYLIACTSTFGQVGDMVDFYMNDGTIVKCVIIDEKSQKYTAWDHNPANKWGHNNGKCIIEFCGTKAIGDNPYYTLGLKGKNVVKAVNGGKYSNSTNSANSLKEDNSNSSSSLGGGQTQGQKIIEEAKKYLGNPYVYGGDSLTNGIDCSHYVWRILQNAIGYSEGYTTSTGWRSRGQAVANLAQAQAGDIICYDGHVGIYDGSGGLIHASNPKSGIKHSASATYASIKAIRRFTTDGGNASDPSTNTEGQELEGKVTGKAKKYVVKVATWSKTTKEQTSTDPDVKKYTTSESRYNVESIDYQQMVSGYTLPFNLLWAFLVVGEQKDFCLAWADLVYNCDLEITVHENYQKNVDKTVKKYKKKVVHTGTVTVTSNTNPPVKKTIPFREETYENHVTTKIITTETITLNSSVTKAETWLTSESKKFEKGNTESHSENDTRDINDDTTVKVGEELPADYTNDEISRLEDQVKKEADTNKVFGASTDTRVTGHTETSNEDIKEETTNSDETTQYIETQSNKKEKLDSESKEENFVTLYKKPKYRKNRFNISSASSWLFEIIKKNEDTANMLDLVKYLLQKATDRYYGVENFDLEKYISSASLNDISDSPGGTGTLASGGKGTIGVYTATNGKKFNLYIQGSPAPWAGNDYGNSGRMSISGCGPTALAIIASAYNGEITPETTRSATIRRYGRGNNSSTVCMNSVLKSIGIGVKTEVSSRSKSKIISCLKNGGQVWLVVRSCKYTSGAHCIALIDYDNQTGKVYVAHGTAKTRPYGWGSLDYILRYEKNNSLLYVGG